MNDMETLIAPPKAASPIVIRYEEGARFDVQIRSHHLTVDQTTRGGGDDTAPEPIELLGASLGSCIAYYISQFCRARSLPCDDLVVTVNQRMADAPRRVASFVVGVSLPPSIPERYLEAVERVIRSCPAHNTLALGARVDVSVTQHG
jgi:uncharacterized OsmC-like protein